MWTKRSQFNTSAKLAPVFEIRAQEILKKFWVFKLNFSIRKTVLNFAAAQAQKVVLWKVKISIWAGILKFGFKMENLYRKKYRLPINFGRQKSFLILAEIEDSVFWILSAHESFLTFQQVFNKYGF